MSVRRRSMYVWLRGGQCCTQTNAGKDVDRVSSDEYKLRVGDHVPIVSKRRRVTRQTNEQTKKRPTNPGQ